MPLSRWLVEWLRLSDAGRFLNNNGLRSLERGVFNELTSVQWLKLNKNRLRGAISPGVFSRLTSLQYLWVVHRQWWNNRWVASCKGKGNEEYLYSAFYILCISQSSQAWITQFYLQIHHACLSFVSVHQMAPPLTEVRDIQLPLTTHLLTPKGWKVELAWLVDL